MHSAPPSLEKLYICDGKDGRNYSIHCIYHQKNSTGLEKSLVGSYCKLTKNSLDFQSAYIYHSHASPLKKNNSPQSPKLAGGVGGENGGEAAFLDIYRIMKSNLWLGWELPQWNRQLRIFIEIGGVDKLLNVREASVGINGNLDNFFEIFQPIPSLSPDCKLPLLKINISPSTFVSSYNMVAKPFTFRFSTSPLLYILIFLRIHYSLSFTFQGLKGATQRQQISQNYGNILPSSMSWVAG